MSGNIAAQIGTLESAQASALASIEELKEAVQVHSNKVLSSLEGVDTQVVSRITEVIDASRAVLESAIESFAESVAAVISGEIENHQQVLGERDYWHL